MPRLLRVLLVTILLATSWGIPATPQVHSTARAMWQEAEELIDFEALTATPWEADDHPPVTHQYKGKGVYFYDATVIDFTNSEGIGPGFTHSGNNAITYCSAGEECTTPLAMIFDPPRGAVRVWVGVNAPITEAIDVRLTAFNTVEGEDVVWIDEKTIDPTGEDWIAVQTPLEVTAFGNVIQRVEVELASPGDASWLVFDDVELVTLPETEVVAEPETTETPCDEAGTRPPSLILNEPTSGHTTQANTITLVGTATSDEPLLEATLIAKGPKGTKETPVPLSLLTQEDGDPTFKIPVNAPLLPDAQTLNFRIRNCAGADTSSLIAVYNPPPAETRYKILGVEVTQTIQDLANSVTLIAGKRTYVRVYLSAVGSTAPLEDVTGVLPVCRAPAVDPPACPADDNPLSTLTSNDVNTVDSQEDVNFKRESLVSSLDFVVPPELTEAGSLSLDLGQLTLAPAFPCENCATFSATPPLVTVEFTSAPPVQVDIVEVVYTKDGTSYQPSALDRQRFISWLERAYPTSEVRLVSQVGDLSGFSSVPTCQEINELMFNEWVGSSERDSDDVLADTPIRFVALVQHPGDATVLEGCAAIDPTLAYAGSFATGISGVGPPYPWDHDGSYADFNGGHELGHIYEQNHVGDCDTASTDDPTPTPDAGMGVAADPTATPVATYPHLDGKISGSDKQYFGFDVGDASMDSVPPPPTEIAMSPYDPEIYTDLMSYCDDRWISAFTYEGILGALPEDDAAPFDVDDDKVEDAETPDEAVVFAAQVPATPPPTTGSEVLVVLGTISLPPGATPTVELRPFSRLSGLAVTPRDANGRYSIVLEDSQNNVLADYPFRPKLYSDPPANTIPTAQLGEVVPWVDGTARIVILAAGQEIGARVVTPNAPRVTITAPNGGGALLPPTVDVTWTATDDDGDALTYSLLYSADNGATWRSIAGGLRDPRYTVDLADLPGSDAAIFRVVATDGVNTGQDDTDEPFATPNNAPAVGIITPATGSRFGSTDTLVLAGRARDVEEGNLDDSALQWSSDIDGNLGEGRSISTTGLAPGLHTITLTATDAADDATTESIQVEIGDDNLPVVTWDPATDTSFFPDGQLYYSDTNRRAEFYTTDGAGEIQLLNTFFTFLDGWTSIVPGHFSGEDALTDLFLYSDQTGLGEFYTSDGEGGLELLSSSKEIPDPATGWEMVIPGDFGGDDTWTDLFFYDLDENQGSFYRSDGDGQLQPLGVLQAFDQEWSIVVPGNFGGDDRTDLLFYNDETGRAWFYTSDGEGRLEFLRGFDDWDPGWSQIIPGNFDGQDDWTDLFFYHGETRDVKFYATDGQGIIVPLGLSDRFATDWTTMIGGDFSGDDTMTDLFLYDGEGGQRVFLTTDGAGGLTEFGRTGATPGWNVIVPGRFTGVSLESAEPEPMAPEAEATPAA